MHDTLQRQQRKATANNYADEFQVAIEDALRCTTRRGCDLYETFTQAPKIRDVAMSLKVTIEREQTRTQQARPMLTSDTLVSLRKFCRSVSYEKSKLNLYSLAGGGGGTLVGHAP